MRALLSVSDKSGIVDLGKELEALGFEIVSTGGTEKMLKEGGLKVTPIDKVTNFPECFDGRVKTLHPKVHGGILARRDLPRHLSQLEELEITPIDLVVINLYPFKKTIKREGVTLEEAIENIDIGGPTMLRAAAKNYKNVTVVSDPSDYTRVIDALKSGETTEEFRYELALKVFQSTAAYDAMISEHLRKEIGAELPENPTFTYEKIQELRYGENPHQRATYYREIISDKGTLVEAEKLHGKELSFNNINDANGALETLKEFPQMAVVAVKHANPCGVATGKNLVEAYRKAHDCDPISIFGGIVACNRRVDKETAMEMNKIFLEIVIAPDYDKDALEILKRKDSLRILKLENIEAREEKPVDIKKVSGGLLVQDGDNLLFAKEEPMKVVTKKQPTQGQMEDMEIAMKVVKHTKSNGIVFVKDGATIAIGPGQTNRIWAVENCIKRCKTSVKGGVMASDAFFPFDDCVTTASDAGILAIVQPGGSLKDQESIDKADEKDIVMVFTGIRHFKH